MPRFLKHGKRSSKRRKKAPRIGAFSQRTAVFVLSKRKAAKRERKKRVDENWEEKEEKTFAFLFSSAWLSLQKKERLGRRGRKENGKGRKWEERNRAAADEAPRWCAAFREKLSHLWRSPFPQTKWRRSLRDAIPRPMGPISKKANRKEKKKEKPPFSF